jgi:hypothetical protein
MTIVIIRIIIINNSGGGIRELNNEKEYLHKAMASKPVAYAVSISASVGLSLPPK